jgi:hypothetical protein
MAGVQTGEDCRPAFTPIEAISCGIYTVFNNTSDTDICYENGLVPTILKDVNVSLFQKTDLCGNNCKRAFNECSINMTRVFKHNHRATDPACCEDNEECIPYVVCVQPCCKQGVPLLISFDEGMVSDCCRSIVPKMCGIPVCPTVEYFGLYWSGVTIWNVPEAIRCGNLFPSFIKGLVSYPNLITNFKEEGCPPEDICIKSCRHPISLLSLYVYTCPSIMCVYVKFTALDCDGAPTGDCYTVKIKGGTKCATLVQFDEGFSNIYGFTVCAKSYLCPKAISIDNLQLCSKWTPSCK